MRPSAGIVIRGTFLTPEPFDPPISAHMRYLRGWRRERILPDMGGSRIRDLAREVCVL